jgi:hypothetical protein
VRLRLRLSKERCKLVVQYTTGVEQGLLKVDSVFFLQVLWIILGSSP